MSAGPRGQGRGASERARRRADDERQERAARLLSAPTTSPRPDWMADPSRLPKRPPAGRQGAP